MPRGGCLSGCDPKDIDPELGNPSPGAIKVHHLYDTVRGAWSLRMIILSRDSPAGHVKWMSASKAEIVAQVRCCWP